MSIFPLKDQIPCGNKYFQDGKYVKTTSPILKKLMQAVQIEAKREENIEKVFSKTRPATATKLEDNIDYIDIQVAEDLKEERRQNFLEQKRRQQLRENNQELKELEVKLRAAYISKGLAAQRAERELLLAKEKEKQNYENELLEKARITYEENERIKDELDKQKKAKLRAELRSQMELHEKLKTMQIEEFKEEKRTVDEIVKKIWEEQYEEQRAKVEARLKLQKEAEEFSKVREMLKNAKKQSGAEEDRDIEALKKEQEERILKQKEKKLAGLKEREKISAAIGKKLHTQIQEKRKRMEVLEDLLIEEKAARDDEQEQIEKVERAKQKQKYKVEICSMLGNNKRRIQEEAEEDKQYRDIILQELAKTDELNRIKEEKKRQMKLDNKQAIRDGLDYKVQLRAKELTELLKQRESDIRENQRQQQLVEEERIKMLQEHAVALQGFFPPGVLRESDRQFLSLPPKDNGI